MADLFVSYSLHDREFVDRLAGGLRDEGIDVRLEGEGVLDGAPGTGGYGTLPAPLRSAIEESDAFLYVLSPASVHSAFCGQEVALASDLNKRIVPVVLREVPDAEVPSQLQQRAWIPAAGPTAALIGRVIAELDRDLAWNQDHTWLTGHALAWERAGRNPRLLLLRGADLAAAEDWLAGSEDAGHAPIALEREYVTAARQAAVRRVRVRRGAGLLAGLVALAVVVVVLVSGGSGSGRAAAGRTGGARRGRASSRGAANPAAAAQSRALAAASEAQDKLDPQLAIRIGEAAVRRQATPAAMFALRHALDVSPLRYQLPAAGPQDCGAPAVSFAAGSDLLAEGLCDGTVVFADGSDGRIVRRVSVAAPVTAVAFSPSGGQLAVAGGGRVTILDAASGHVIGHGPAVRASSRLAWAPNSALLAAAGASRVELYNAADGSVRTLPVPARTTPGGALAFSPDGRRLALSLTAAPSDPAASGLAVVSVATGSLVARLPGAVVADLAYAPSGRVLATAEPGQSGAAGRIQLRGGATLALVRTLARLPGTAPRSVAFNPAGTEVVYGAADGTAELVGLPRGRRLLHYAGATSAITQVAFAPDGQEAATASLDGAVRVWRGWRPALTAVRLPAGSRSFALDGRRIVALAPQAGQTGLWAVGVGLNGGAVGRPRRVASTLALDAAWLSQDGRLAATIGTAARGGGGTITDLATGRTTVVALPEATGPAPQFSPDGHEVALETGTTAILADPATGARVTLGAGSCPSGWDAFSFSADGRYLAGGDACGSVTVWNAVTGRAVGSAIAVGGSVSSVAFRPGGGQLAAGSSNGTAVVVAFPSGRRLAVLALDRAAVDDVVYSPSGRYLATASVDSSVRIWDARTLGELRVIGQPSPPRRILFADGDAEIVAVGADHTVRTFDTCPDCQDPAALLALARSRVPGSPSARPR